MTRPSNSFSSEELEAFDALMRRTDLSPAMHAATRVILNSPGMRSLRRKMLAMVQKIRGEKAA